MFATSELIQKMRFHLPLFALAFFRTNQKPPQAIVKMFLRIKGCFFVLLGISITRF